MNNTKVRVNLILSNNLRYFVLTVRISFVSFSPSQGNSDGFFSCSNIVRPVVENRRFRSFWMALPATGIFLVTENDCWFCRRYRQYSNRYCCVRRQAYKTRRLFSMSIDRSLVFRFPNTTRFFHCGVIYFSIA